MEHVHEVFDISFQARTDDTVFPRDQITFGPNDESRRSFTNSQPVKHSTDPLQKIKHMKLKIKFRTG